MSDIYHDPTRGWLLLTEKWPEKPLLSTAGNQSYLNGNEWHKQTGGYRDPQLWYNEAVAHCLSTAIEIDEDDWVEIRKKSKFAFKDHHPYSVDAEFEVVEQWRRKYADTTRENSNQWEDFTPPTATKQSFNEYRQIARLVKAKEKDFDLALAESGVYFEQPTEAVKPTESQDELCGTCGHKLVFIRGKYPKSDNRAVCPQCVQEKLDQIQEISSDGYGKACVSG